MEDGRNPEPKVTSIKAFELRRTAKVQEVQREELAKFFKTKRALLHSGYETCSPEAQACDRKILNVHADKITARELDRQMLNLRANSVTKPESKQKEREIQR